MPYPSGVGDVDCAAAQATVQAAIGKLTRGGHAGNVGALQTLNCGLGALIDMQNNTGSSPAHGNTTLYTSTDWASFAAAAQQLARMATANGDPATAMMCIAAASLFTSV